MKQWTLKRLFLIALAIRLVYALVLHVNGAYHGDELQIDLGAQLFAGLDEFQIQRQVDLFQEATEGEILTSRSETLERRDVLWMIEAVQSMSIGELLLAVLTDPASFNFPGFYVWVGLTYLLFGYEPLVYRLLSALIGALSIPILYRIGTKLGFSERATKMGCLLFATLPLAFQYSGTFYKEAIAQFLFLLIFWLFLERRILLVVALLVLTFLVRPTTAIVFLSMVFLTWIFQKKTLLQVGALGIFVALFLPLSNVAIIGRSFGGLAATLENTALLSKLPIMLDTLGGAIVSNVVLGVIGLLQPIPFLYGRDAGAINHLVVSWTVTGFEWAFTGAIVISSVLLFIKHGKKLPGYYYVLSVSFLFVWVCGFGAAANESVRYRDLFYPFMLLLIGWNQEVFSRTQRLPGVALVFYPLFFIGVAYALTRWFV